MGRLASFLAPSAHIEGLLVAFCSLYVADRRVRTVDDMGLLGYTCAYPERVASEYSYGGAEYQSRFLWNEERKTWYIGIQEAGCVPIKRENLEKVDGRTMS